MKTLPSNMSSLFDKLNDLKIIFKFTERVVPIIQNLTEFMKEVVPLLENINSSIAETTSKIPQASNQINNVTNATELATTEILDLVDEITSNLENSEKTINNFLTNTIDQNQKLIKLKSLLKGNTEASKLLEEIIIDEKEETELGKVVESLSKSRNDTYKITLSLQVQDITAQQLAAVNHLIQSVHFKLSTLIDNIEQAELDDDFEDLRQSIQSHMHFDPNASYLNSAGRQESVDKIIYNQNIKTSQEEIDKLFG
jgi:chemotaxis regulatin CheY-phosphate phosphatase CheZ